MKQQTSDSTARPSLANLAQVQLSDLSLAILENAKKVCGGPPIFRARKIAEARDLLALAQISDRLVIHWLDLSVDLRAKIELRVPVPVLPDPSAPLRVEPRALLGLIYSEEAAILPQPGYAFVRILAPRPVWASNVSPDVNQVLCLGASLPAGILLKELILMTFGSLTMQTTQLDVMDPAGLLNPAAAEWWQRNADRIPLSTEPFLQKETEHAG